MRKYKMELLEICLRLVLRRTLGWLSFAERWGLEDTDAKGNFDLLKFWREHRKQYPVLSRMTRDVLAVQASTIASESAFSQGRVQLGEHRHSMKESLEKSVLFRDWIRAQRRNFGIMDNEEENKAYEEILSESTNGGSGDELPTNLPAPTGPPPNLDAIMRHLPGQ